MEIKGDIDKNWIKQFISPQGQKTGADRQAANKRRMAQIDEDARPEKEETRDRAQNQPKSGVEYGIKFLGT